LAETDRESEKKETIPHISPDLLRSPDYLEASVYPTRDIRYYWSDAWDPLFYADLARAGFISVAMDIERFGPVLLPEIQSAYAVLDWENLHISGHIRKILNRGALEKQRFSLILSDDPERVTHAIRDQFGEENWLIPRYGDLLRELASFPFPEGYFRLVATELYEENSLVAGELGYAIGATYTSLTGFSSRLREHRNRGTLQLVLLARFLREGGFAFWNLGHPHMDYKLQLGCCILKREEFLQRWLRESNRKLEPG